MSVSIRWTPVRRIVQRWRRVLVLGLKSWAGIGVKTKSGGKLRDAVRTRAAILAAAQQAFSDKGYSATGIRDIAEIADVSSSLIDRYFGSKIGLFEAALIDSMREMPIFDEGKAGFGERLSRRLMEPDLDNQLLAMSVLAAADDEARELVVRFTQDYIVEPLAQWLGAPNARARAMQLLMLGRGFVTYTHLLPVEVSKTASAMTRHWLAESLQAIVDQSE